MKDRFILVERSNDEKKLAFDSVKDCLKYILGLNEDRHYITDDSTGNTYSFREFIDTFVIEESLEVKNPYEDKIDWMKKNGWSFDEEYIYDEDDITVYIDEIKNERYHWTKKDVEALSLADIKKYKAWYDDLISFEELMIFVGAEKMGLEE
nr:MAG TPA: hypothetical protein [Caudoviricetes sp.]